MWTYRLHWLQKSKQNRADIQKAPSEENEPSSSRARAFCAPISLRAQKEPKVSRSPPGVRFSWRTQGHLVSEARSLPQIVGWIAGAKTRVWVPVESSRIKLLRPQDPSCARRGGRQREREESRAAAGVPLSNNHLRTDIGPLIPPELILSALKSQGSLSSQGQLATTGQLECV